MKKAMRSASVGVTLALVGLGLVACSSGSGGGTSAGETGPITYVQGKDTSGVVPKYAPLWNKMHPDQKVTIKQQTDQADQQHQDLVQHFQQKQGDYDVVSTDVVWTAEFAAKGYLQPLTGAYKLDTAPFLPSVVKTGQYHGVQYAAPSSTDSQILYYRKDLLGSKTPPSNWDELMADCSIAKKHNIDCYSGQFAKYEGLTVNFNEAITSEGGTVVDGARVHQVPGGDADPDAERHRRLHRAGAVVAVHRRGAGQEVPVPDHPEGVPRQRGGPPDQPVLPGDHRGDRGQHLQGAAIGVAGRVARRERDTVGDLVGDHGGRLTPHAS